MYLYEFSNCLAYRVFKTFYNSLTCGDTCLLTLCEIFQCITELFVDIWVNFISNCSINNK